MDEEDRIPCVFAEDFSPVPLPLREVGELGKLLSPMLEQW